MRQNPAFDGLAVLVVDDQKIIHNMLSHLLLKVGFKEVDSAFNGSQALKALDAKRYDLILCDIMMDDLDGIGFVQTLRQPNNLRYDIGKSRTPVMLMSGSTDSEHLRAAKEVGVQGYIVKPFDPASVYERLAKLFGG